MNKKICECGKVMRFVKTKNNQTMPVNEDSLHPDELSALDNGMDVDYDPTRHVSHFIDCPEAKKFRRRKK